MHIYLTRLKTFLRKKDFLFWVFAFPLILAIIFNLSFGNISYGVKITTIDFVIVDTGDYMVSNDFISSASLVKIDDNTNLFNIIKMTYELANNAFENGEIQSFLYYDDGYKIITNSSSYEMTVIKSFIDQYASVNIALERYYTTNPAPSNIEIMSIIEDYTNQMSFIKNVSLNDDIDAMLIFFYALIAMACLMSSYLGADIITSIRADQSAIGSRVTIAPTHKFKLLGLYFLASFTFQAIGNILLMLFLKFVIGIEFGSQFFLVLMTMLAGSISGIMLGMFLACFIKTQQKIESISTAITLILSAMAGLMSTYIKRAIDLNAPIVNKVNPANLITEGLYCLVYYDNLDRYLVNILSLIGISIIMLVFVYIRMRGEKYESI